MIIENKYKKELKSEDTFISVYDVFSEWHS